VDNAPPTRGASHLLLGLSGGLMYGSVYVVQDRSHPVPKSAKTSLRKRPDLLIGAYVRLRRGQHGQATGVVIGNSTAIDRVQVRWDDTGEVTHCPKANLTLVFPDLKQALIQRGNK
jgi:hypothetical protein